MINKSPLTPLCPASGGSPRRQRGDNYPKINHTISSRTRKHSGLRSAGLPITLLILASIYLLSGCGPRYATRQIDPSDAFRSYTSSVLTSGELRLGTMQKLRLLFLDKEYQKSPDDVIRKLMEMHVKGAEPGLLPVISELAYLEASKADSNLNRATAYYLMAAACANDYLYSRASNDNQNLVSPIALFMAEMYNSAVSKIVMARQRSGVSWADPMGFDIGSMRYSLKTALSGDMLWTPQYFDRFQPAYEVYIEGLRNIYRSHGLGASMIGIRSNSPAKLGYEEYFSPEVILPVTAAIEFDQTDREKTDDRSGVLKFYDPLDVRSIRLGQKQVPLDTDYSATFGLLMTRIDPSQYELKGLLNPDRYMKSAGIYMLEPYDPEKIPVLMTHGLYSSPSTFIEMFNDLRGSAEIRKNYQFWFFFYPTGLPILESGAILRKELLEYKALFDPESTSPEFNKMVLIGHSMGGILSRMMTQSSGSLIWDAHFEAPFEVAGLTPEERAQAAPIFFFDPLPFVKRTVFIATPHRGSGMAKPWITRLASKVISMPGGLFLNSASFLLNNKKKQAADDDVTATSISQLAPESPFMTAASGLSLNRGVSYHSIIAVKDSETGPGSTDGVVPYESAHLEGISSERLVPESHSCLEHPLTIAEVRRILLEHIRDVRSASR